MSDFVAEAAEHVARISEAGDYQDQLVGHAFATFAAILREEAPPSRNLLLQVVDALEAHGEIDLANRVRKEL